MDRQASILRAVRVNLRVAIIIAAFTSVVIAIADQPTWGIMATVWLGWLGFAVIIGVLRGWGSGM
jgi:hypothetical protein